MLMIIAMPSSSAEHRIAARHPRDQRPRRRRAPRRCRGRRRPPSAAPCASCSRSARRARCRARSTVSVCVAALPPMPATIGMKTASAVTRARSCPRTAPTTAAARNAVTRLTPSHGSRLRSDSAAGVNDALVAGHAGQAVDVLGRLVLDDVDDVVDGDDADQLVLLVDDRNRQQVVGRDLPRHFFLVHVDAGADRDPPS